jgi:tellurite resistance protein
MMPRAGPLAVASLRARSRDLLITPPLFGMTFGFAGLSGAWRVPGQHWMTVVADLLTGIAAVLAVALAIPWVSQLVRRESDLRAELSDPVLGPSVPVIAISAMLLSTTLLVHAEILGRALLILFAFLTLAGGVAVVAAWIVTRLPLHRYHPGFYLPTAGGTLLTAQCVTSLGWVWPARTLFFVGLACWLILGVITSLRLARTPLPPALRPVVVIEIAAPALASNTYVVVFHRYDGYALALTTVTIVMGIVQLILTPYYRRAPFGAAFWAGAFSYATTAALALRWIDHEHPNGAALWRVVTLALATGVVVLLSVATVSAIRHGEFFTQKNPIEPAR